MLFMQKQKSSIIYLKIIEEALNNYNAFKAKHN